MKIQGSKCIHCSKVVLPSRETCPFCFSTSPSTEVVELEPKGTVLSHTTLEMPPAGFTPPVHLALVELEQGATTLCLVKGNVIESISIGVSLILEYDTQGRIIGTGIPK